MQKYLETVKTMENLKRYFDESVYELMKLDFIDGCFEYLRTHDEVLDFGYTEVCTGDYIYRQVQDDTVEYLKGDTTMYYWTDNGVVESIITNEERISLFERFVSEIEKN